LAAIRFLRQLGYFVVAFESSADSVGLAECRGEFPEVPTVVGPLNELPQSTVQQDHGFPAEATSQSPAGLLMMCSQILLSPGVPRALAAIQAAIAAGISVRGDVDWFAEGALRPILAVTGSNGKSTVVSWLAHILAAMDLQVGLGGNIGIPVLDLLQHPEPAVYVLELSSFQLESTERLACEVACVLNVSEDHMDRYESFEAYALAKQRIYRGAKHVVVNRADPLTYGLFPQGVQVHSFGLDRPERGQFGLIQRGGKAYLAQGDNCLIAVERLQLKGEHQAANALAVLAIASAFGLPLAPLLEPLSTFSGLPHRCEVVGECADVTFYNDSKATNVGAAVSAVEGLGPLHRVDDQPGIVLLLGGRGKGADFTPLRSVVAKHVAQVYVFGESAEALFDVLHDVVPVERVDSMLTALPLAKARACASGAVLLSPACASLDQFENFQARGQQFKSWVRQNIE
jgi:UDP-N-acetylmuramoylalanine--D-glutamate ligase